MITNCIHCGNKLKEEYWGENGCKRQYRYSCSCQSTNSLISFGVWYEVEDENLLSFHCGIEELNIRIILHKLRFSNYLVIYDLDARVKLFEFDEMPEFDFTNRKKFVEKIKLLMAFG